MRVIDSNIHLPPKPNLEHELDMHAFDSAASLKHIGSELGRLGIEGGNIMILDPAYIRKGDHALIEQANELGLRVTVMLDPRQQDAFQNAETAVELGLVGIKYHPYLQGLSDEYFPQALALAKHVDSLGMCIEVDCSYGTKRLYEISGVRLVNALSDVFEGTLVALHGGGKLVIDLMSIAQEAEQLIMDLSFSIPYWLGSSVEADFAFAIRQLGPGRVMYGSDYPYIPFDESIARTRGFLEQNDFSQQEIETIFFHTAAKVFGYDQ